MPCVPITASRSPITAVAVSAPPAPGPSRMTSRIDSPRSITALNAPSTVASGWSRLDEAGVHAGDDGGA